MRARGRPRLSTLQRQWLHVQVPCAHTITHTYIHFASEGGTCRCLALHARAHTLSASAHAQSVWVVPNVASRRTRTLKVILIWQLFRKVTSSLCICVVLHICNHLAYIAYLTYFIFSIYCILTIYWNNIAHNSYIAYIFCIFVHILHMVHIYVYSANIVTFSCRRSKRNAAEAEGAAAAAGRAGRRPQGAGLWAGPGGAPGSPYPGESA